jgi:hypothetical protein
MFVEEPVVPLAILLHDTKCEQAHNRFVQILHNQIPEIGKHCVLITDCEDALKKAFRFFYPTVEQLRCWNHLGKNIKAGIKKYYLPAQQIAYADPDEQDPSVISKKKREIISNVIDSITNLLRATSKLEFKNQYNDISQIWPSGFRDWFNRNLLATIDEMGQLKDLVYV